MGEETTVHFEMSLEAGRNALIMLTALLLLCVLILFSGCIGSDFFGKSYPEEGNLIIEQTIGGKSVTSVNVEIVHSEKDREIGLTEHTKIEEGEGMWFIFDEPKRYPFWTKGMKFSIDIIWVDRDYNIVDLKENLKPCNLVSCPQYRSEVPIMYALEVPAGFIMENSIRIGKKIDVSWE